MSTVALVDLGVGNLRSVARALERAGATVERTADPDAVRTAARIVVPGQGAFRDCARALAPGLGEALREAIAKGTPYLGICLGMQVLFEGSEEAPAERGLGLFRGTVVRFDEHALAAFAGEPRLKVPHMGWNEVLGNHPFVPERAWFYFVHSYRCVPSDASETVGLTDHGGPFCAAVARGPLFACQFHPEKSGRAGHALLARFLGS